MGLSQLGGVGLKVITRAVCDLRDRLAEKAAGRADLRAVASSLNQDRAPCTLHYIQGAYKVRTYGAVDVRTESKWDQHA